MHCNHVGDKRDEHRSVQFNKGMSLRAGEMDSGIPELEKIVYDQPESVVDLILQRLIGETPKYMFSGMAEIERNQPYSCSFCFLLVASDRRICVRA